jgi:predicted aminopeptidase
MIKQALRLIFQIILLLFFTVCLFWYKMVIYGIQQGKGQLEMVWDARPAAEVLNDPAFPEPLKQKLRLITEIKQFTIDSLGMNPSKNYNAVYDQKGSSTLLVVSACEPLKLKPKEWTFPFLGSVPYKGFFDKKEAKAELTKLKAEGYDTDVYSPSGWSTLGWFKDPVLSSMLKRDEGELSSLIIHELTHGTLFIKNDVNFNENLANFIGDKGAEKFLSYKFGRESKQYIAYEHDKADEKMYDDFILKSSDRLDSLYKNSIEENDIVRKEKKKKLILEIVVGVNRLPLFDKKRYFNYTLQAFTEGNAFFMAFTRYDSQYEFFESEYTRLYNSDLKKYMLAMKEKYPSL